MLLSWFPCTFTNLSQQGTKETLILLSIFHSGYKA